MEKKDRLIAKLSLVLALLFFIGILAVSFIAVKEMAADYFVLKNADLSQGLSAGILYNDRLYGQIMHGIILDPGDPGNAAAMESFLKTALGAIDRRIIVCGILYTMLTMAVMAYYLYHTDKDNGVKHVIRIALTAVVLFTVFMTVILISHLAMHMPFYFNDAYGMLIIITALAAIIAGNCALAVLLRKVPFKKTAAIISIPVVFALFIFSAQFETRLVLPDKVDSFEYLNDLIMDDSLESRYDEERNVMIIGDKEYEPETADNPDALRGVGRIAAIAFEALDPYSGNSLFMADDFAIEAGTRVGVIMTGLYLIKAAAWIVIAIKVRTKE